MNNKLLDTLVRIIPKRIKRKILEEYHVIPFGNISYSQEGEDLLLSRYFENKNQGFFIDIGAHHPVRYSNTYKLYLKGWRGINIDAAPGSMDAFRNLRNEDINIEAAISDIKKEMIFYIFNDPALNTLSKKNAEMLEKLNGFKIIDRITVPTSTINEILDSLISPGQEIDFLTIDIEGFDTEVLHTFDFIKYSPELILFEIKDFAIDNNTDIIDFLKQKGYNFYAKTVNTVFFRKEKFIND